MVVMDMGIHMVTVRRKALNLKLKVTPKFSLFYSV